jgi:hypothetical protein
MNFFSHAFNEKGVNNSNMIEIALRQSSESYNLTGQNEEQRKKIHLERIERAFYFVLVQQYNGSDEFARKLWSCAREKVKSKTTNPSRRWWNILHFIVETKMIQSISNRKERKLFFERIAQAIVDISNGDDIQQFIVFGSVEDGYLTSESDTSEHTLVDPDIIEKEKRQIREYEERVHCAGNLHDFCFGETSLKEPDLFSPEVLDEITSFETSDELEPRKRKRITPTNLNSTI